MKFLNSEISVVPNVDPHPDLKCPAFVFMLFSIFWNKYKKISPTLWLFYLKLIFIKPSLLIHWVKILFKLSNFICSPAILKFGILSTDSQSTTSKILEYQNLSDLWLRKNIFFNKELNMQLNTQSQICLGAVEEHTEKLQLKCKRRRRSKKLPREE